MPRNTKAGAKHYVGDGRSGCSGSCLTSSLGRARVGPALRLRTPEHRGLPTGTILCCASGNAQLSIQQGLKGYSNGNSNSHGCSSPCSTRKSCRCALGCWHATANSTASPLRCTVSLKGWRLRLIRRQHVVHFHTTHRVCCYRTTICNHAMRTQHAQPFSQQAVRLHNFSSCLKSWRKRTKFV